MIRIITSLLLFSALLANVPTISIVATGNVNGETDPCG